MWRLRDCGNFWKICGFCFDIRNLFSNRETFPGFFNHLLISQFMH